MAEYVALWFSYMSTDHLAAKQKSLADVSARTLNRGETIAFLTNVEGRLVFVESKVQHEHLKHT